MTLLFCDSFDHYTTLSDKGWSANSTSIASTNGRFGTSYLQIPSSQNSAQRALPGSYGTLIVGGAWKMDSTSHTGGVGLIRLMEGTTIHLTLDLTTTSRLRIGRDDLGSAPLATGTTVLSSGVYYYIELKATIHDTTGSYTLRINGVNELTATNIDTRNGLTGVIDLVKLGGTGSGFVGSTQYWDDFVILDTTGSAPTNDFLGDVRVQALLPNGNGNSSMLVGSDGNSTDNYLLVDETTPSSADYVESSTVNDKDTYAFGDLTPTSGTVYGVQVLPYAAKTDAGTRSIVSVARLSGGTEADSADKTLSTSYAYLPDIRETKPGGGAWSISDVNSAEFGVKVSQ